MALTRVAFPLVLQSPVTGSALVGAKATITKHEVGKALGSGPEAEIFTSETEATKVSGNTIVSDSTGRWTQGEAEGFRQYWLPQGTYDITISGTGLTAITITRELVSGSTVAALASPALEGFTEHPGTAEFTRTISPAAGHVAIVVVSAAASNAAVNLFLEVEEVEGGGRGASLSIPAVTGEKPKGSVTYAGTIGKFALTARVSAGTLEVVRWSVVKF